MPLWNQNWARNQEIWAHFFFLYLSHINSVKSNLSALWLPVHKTHDVGESAPGLVF